MEPIEEFYREFGRALDDRDAALFAGAGLSVGAGLKTWPDLLAEVASDLGLAVDRETDLAALAQFHVNERRVRTRLNQLLIDEFGGDTLPSENHRLLARLPIETVWTTNYDPLIERAFRDAGRRCDVKVTTANLATTIRGRDVTIYKMHGDVTQPQDAILTKEEFELYGIARESFITALRGDLVKKTFLFLGFSFTDPNMDLVLGRIRALLGQNPRQHYCVMKRPEKPQGDPDSKAEYDYEVRRLGLRVSDLQRYGIRAVMVDDYAEITAMLEELNRRAHRKTVFVSGSAFDYSPLGERRVESLATILGRELIRNGFSIVSGFGLGVGSALLAGAMEEVYRTPDAVLADRIIMRPFPQAMPGSPGHAELYTRYRRESIAQAGAAVFLCGNRQKAGTDEVELAAGVIEEFEIASDLGKSVIPVGATGSASRELWERVAAEPGRYLPSGAADGLKVIGDPKVSDEEIVKSVISILESINKS